MAENEALDVGNKRFRWVISDIIRRKSPEEIANRILKRLVTILNHVRRHGFDLEAVLSEASRGGDLRQLIRDTGGSDLAHIISQCSRPMATRESILSEVLRRAFRSVIDSGVQAAVGDDAGLNLMAASAIKSETERAASKDIKEMAAKLAANPKAVVRMAAVAKAIPATTASLFAEWARPAQPSLLYQSLLARPSAASQIGITQ